MRLFPTLHRAVVLGSSLLALGAARADGKLAADEKQKLVSALGDRSEGMKVRLQAALILGRSGGSDVVPALLDALGDPEFPVRGAACLALGNVGDDAAIDGLTGRLADPEGFVRDEAVDALAHLYTRGQATSLERRWPRLEVTIRSQLTRVIQKLGSGLGDKLEAIALGDADPGVQAAAREVLARWTPPEVQRLVLTGLYASEPHLRATAAKVAAEKHLSLAIARLEQMLVSPEETAETVEAARSALFAMSEQLDLAGTLQQAREGLPHEREQALAVLAAARAPQAFDELMAALDDRDLAIRAAAARDLGALGDPRAADKLAVLAGRDENAPIQRTLQTSLRALQPR